MRRRDFITFVGGAATWPFTARAAAEGLARWVSRPRTSDIGHAERNP